MYVKNEYAERFFDTAGRAFAQEGVRAFVGSDYVAAFEEQLKAMAELRQYQQGERIMPSDLTVLREGARTLLEDMAEKILEKGSKTLPNKEWRNYDPLLAMTAVTDYLYAMAMKTLGCPDIPEGFGDEFVALVGELSTKTDMEIKRSEYRKTDVDRHFKEQRGKSAETVRKAAFENRKRIAQKTASPLRVAQYAAEYRALKKRQEGHTAIWRFFHKKENAARTALLESMKSLLVKVVGNDPDVDIATPAEVAAAYRKAGASAAFAKGNAAKRANLPEDGVSHEPTSTARAERDKEEPYVGRVYAEEERVALELPAGEFEEVKGAERTAPAKEEDQPVRETDPQVRSQL